MFELDFAYYDSSVYDMALMSALLGQGGQGGIEDGSGGDPGTGVLEGDPPGGWVFPVGAEVISITNVALDEYGEEVLEEKVMIRLESDGRFIDYLEWKSSFDTTTPEERSAVDWVPGLIDKVNAEILVTRTLSVVNGEQIEKLQILIREDGELRYMTLNEWEAWQDKLDYLDKLKAGKMTEGG